LVSAYPSENAAWIGLARYQLLIGKQHPVTAAMPGVSMSMCAAPLDRKI
jgi:hypothetical protein